MNQQKIEVSLAILFQNGKFLMQLRDDIPNILYPGHWGLFGGHLEAGEIPEEGVKREILEEINYPLINPIKWQTWENENIIRHIFSAPLTVPIDQLTLLEGWDLALLSPDEIKTGFHYSEKAQSTKPIGLPHQKILLDFLTINN